jgi:DNA ligase (NAD+)
MDVEGLGEERLKRMVSGGAIRSVSDLYYLTRDQLRPYMLPERRDLDKVKQKREDPNAGFAVADLVLSEIERSKSAGFGRALFALGIREVGEKLGKTLAQAFGSVRLLEVASEEALLSVPDVGPETARSVREWFTLEANRSLVHRLEQAGVRMVEEKVSAAPGPLLGKTFVITGVLEGVTRDEATALVEDAGGKVASSVSRRTTALIAGRDAGSKLSKAQSLGIAVWDLSDLRRAIEGEEAAGGERG